MAIGTASGALLVACCLVCNTAAWTTVPPSTSVGFVVDVTGSMSTDISYLRKALYNATYHLEHFKSLGISYFVLATFSDPKSLTTVKTYYSLHDLYAGVSSLKATGGDDCPEYGLDGLNVTIRESKYNSIIFYFSDAAVKEEHLASSVANAAKAKNIRIWIMETGCCTGKCSVYSPYSMIATMTGGAHYKIKKEQIPLIMQYVNENIRCRNMYKLQYPPSTFSGIEAWLKSHKGCAVSTPPAPTLPPTMGAIQLTAHFLTMVVTAVVAATFV